MGDEEAGRYDATQQAFNHLLDRESIEVQPAALALLAAHLRSNISFQERAIKAFADLSAGAIDLEDVEKMLKASELSDRTLLRFLEELLKEPAQSE
ncbi:hypothetical protein [Mangrovibrevibacter kandeliae]|uniref:hypothetical protein n=1 Tax=Mangrovibrevibacter kandeliae TaxID=2968473 RepID=UPI00211993F3|nr:MULTISPECIES: hypothetical protein [unclassified Aurantimonas]MCQ8782229.1 hypothetical protein [Aurantimonas sp. CSK15Z-1]MCW4115120.1 hypothetical protein [Aurantimonas sp. MSK8Z-1]